MKTIVESVRWLEIPAGAREAAQHPSAVFIDRDQHSVYQVLQVFDGKEWRDVPIGDVSQSGSTPPEPDFTDSAANGRSRSNAGLARRVDEHMRLHYRVSLADLEQTDVPGYWRDKEPKIHPGHPLHSCLGCDGPFRATYTYFDPPRIGGRFASVTRTWAALRANEPAQAAGRDSGQSSLQRLVGRDGG